MNETVLTIPEIGYRCREAITTSCINEMCLIPGSINLAGGITKARLNVYGVVDLYSRIVQYSVEFDATKMNFLEQPLLFFDQIIVGFGTTTHDDDVL